MSLASVPSALEKTCRAFPSESESTEQFGLRSQVPRNSP